MGVVAFFMAWRNWGMLLGLLAKTSPSSCQSTASATLAVWIFLKAVIRLNSKVTIQVGSTGLLIHYAIDIEVQMHMSGLLTTVST